MKKEEVSDTPITSNTTAVPSFEEAVAKVASQEAKPLPKKRGRPPKSAQGAESVSTGAISGMNQPPVAGGSPGAPLAGSAGFDIPKEALVPLLQFPFAIASRKTGFSGWELSKEETDALVPMLDAVLKQYLPQVSGPHAALMMFGGSLAVMTGVRYSMYLDYRRELSESKAANAKMDIGGSPTSASRTPEVTV